MFRSQHARGGTRSPHFECLYCFPLLSKNRSVVRHRYSPVRLRYVRPVALLPSSCEAKAKGAGSKARGDLGEEDIEEQFLKPSLVRLFCRLSNPPQSSKARRIFLFQLSFCLGPRPTFVQPTFKKIHVEYYLDRRSTAGRKPLLTSCIWTAHQLIRQLFFSNRAHD